MVFDITGQKRWGILGDGQLARMLVTAAYPLGVRPVVLTGDPSSSAGQVSQLQVRGHLDNRDDVHALLSQVDGAIIESEFVNCDLIESTGLAEKVFPSISAIRILQNKFSQKKCLAELNIATSPVVAEGQLWDEAKLKALVAECTMPIVFKYATFGYDGKGVYVVKTSMESDIQGALEFLEGATKRRISVYAEEWVDYVKEVAMVAVRGADSDFKTWPLVVSEQRGGVCDRVIGPATAEGVPATFESQAQAICEQIARHLNLIGVFAVEFFVTCDHQLLVNEIAPRVHNTGHYTLDSGCSSQFENHWRAVLGLTLGSTETVPFFAMQNILGPAGITSKECARPPFGASLIHSHWYGKRGLSPGRKLGHFNACAHDLSQKGDVLASLASAYGRWVEEQRQSFLPPAAAFSQPLSPPPSN